MKVQTHRKSSIFLFYFSFLGLPFYRSSVIIQYLFCQASQGSKKGMLRLQGAQFGRRVSITLMHQSLSKVSRTQRTETCFATSKRRRLSKLAELVIEGRCWRWYIGTYCSGGGGVMLKERVDGQTIYTYYLCIYIYICTPSPLMLKELKLSCCISLCHYGIIMFFCYFVKNWCAKFVYSFPVSFPGHFISSLIAA